MNSTAYSTAKILAATGPVVSENPLSLEEFEHVSEKYPELILERKASGRVIIAPPLSASAGENQIHLSGHLYAWNLKYGKPGRVCSPSTGFLLSGEEVRCGDAVWVSNERLAPFLADPDHKDKWVNVVPEFVVELRSKSDSLKKLKRKMTDTWMANGVLLGWLVDPKKEVAYIYRQGRDDVEEVRDFDTSELSGEEVLTGFVFPLADLNL